jgi:hypothetical protein
VARAALDAAVEVVKALAEAERAKLSDPSCENPALHTERHNAIVSVGIELVRRRGEIVSAAIGG